MRRKTITRVWIWLVLLLVVGGGLYGWGLPRTLEYVIERVGNQNLADRLGLETVIREVVVAPGARRVDLFGLRIAQPEAYGTGDLLYVAEASAEIDVLALLRGRVQIDNVVVRRPTLDVRVDLEGVANLQVVVAQIRERTPEEPVGDIFPVHLRAVAVHDGVVHYRELETPERKVDFMVKDIEVQARHLRSGRNSQTGIDTPATIRSTAMLPKPRHPDGRIGVAARIGPLGRTRPPGHVSIRVVGLELALLKPLLPDGTAAVLGGDALDLAVDMRGDEEFLSGRARVETIAGYRYEATLHGTPERPRIDTDDDALSYLLVRAEGGLGNLFHNAFSVGTGAVEAAATVTTEVAQGVATTVGSFGSGLWNAIRGVFTWDGSRLGRGSKEMGAALAGGATDAVFTATDEVMEGAGSITGALVGDESADRWRHATPQRWEKAWHDAVNTVEQAEFPPRQSTD